MDDILVNFDPERVRAGITTMLELAESNQVLFFTCHPEAVSLIKELDPQVTILRLEAGGAM
jgi:uncharacterized protein YhaN